MGIENPVHLIFIGIVALLVLGPKRLPELARALGHGIREFREAVSNPGEALKAPDAQPPAVQAPVAQPPIASAPSAQQPAAHVESTAVEEPESAPSDD